LQGANADGQTDGGGHPGGLAGLAVGFWDGQDELAARWQAEHIFKPNWDAGAMNKLYRGWQRAVGRARGWADVEE
jgi:glycerol kinase